MERTKDTVNGEEITTFIEARKLPPGWKAILLKWNTEHEMYDMVQTGFMYHEDRKGAEREARGWGACEELMVYAEGKWITPPDPRHTCEECGKPENDDEGSWAPDPVRFFCGKDCHEKWMNEHPEEDAAEKEFFGIEQ